MIRNNPKFKPVNEDGEPLEEDEETLPAQKRPLGTILPESLPPTDEDEDDDDAETDDGEEVGEEAGDEEGGGGDGADDSDDGEDDGDDDDDDDKKKHCYWTCTISEDGEIIRVYSSLTATVCTSNAQCHPPTCDITGDETFVSGSICVL